MTLHITKVDSNGEKFFNFSSVNGDVKTRFGFIQEKYADKLFKVIYTYEDTADTIRYTDQTDSETAELPDWLRDYLDERHSGPFYFTYKINKTNI
jgi:hypothetical protein